MPITTLIATVAVLASSTAHAGHYKWKDENGSIHVADTLGQVPPQFRDKVKTIGIDPPVKTAPVVAPQRPPQPPARRPVPQQAPQSQAPQINFTASVPDNQPGRSAVPFQRSGTVVIVAAVFNDKLATNVVVDTGASMTMITNAAAKALGIDLSKAESRMQFHTANGTIEAPVITMDSIAVGDMKLNKIAVVVHDWSPNSDLHGLLGLNYLKHFKIDFDTDRSQLVLESKTPTNKGP